MRARCYRSRTGFSLVELVTVVAIISIVTALSVGGYRQHLYRTNRSDAIIALLRVAAAQERHFLNHQVYAGRLEQLGLPENSDRGLYRLSLEANARADRYRAQARPAPDKQQRGDRHCTLFTIDQSGFRRAEGRDQTDPDRCWQ